MAENGLDSAFQKAKHAQKLHQSGNSTEALKVALELEADAAQLQDPFEKAECQKYAAGFLIDIGGELQDEDMIRRGTGYYLEWYQKYGDEKDQAFDLYNTANGYMSIWMLEATKHQSDAIETEDYRAAITLYRAAIAHLKLSPKRQHLACEIWVNYGLALKYGGRFVEAIDAFSEALKIDPNMSMALVNKGKALTDIAFLMDGYTHRYFLEALRLFKKVKQSELTGAAKAGLADYLSALDEIVNAHEHMHPETITPLTPANPFQKFLCEFCAEHGLFLNPITLLGDEEQAFYGDPIYINKMAVPVSDRDRANRYVTFLNEIKQDYVLGRYFLVQSQRRSDDLDTVDEGVALVYPLDYSSQSVYIQLLKAAMKQAISVLDKVAYFINDYCDLKIPDEDISFKRLWGGNSKMPKKLAKYQNLFLIALFNIYRDVTKDEDWSKIYDHRNALTHRYLVLHEYMVHTRPHDNIPREQEADFLKTVILATRIARAAVMYLIFFVALEEEKTLEDDDGKPTPTLPAVPLDKNLRHRPKF